MKFDLNNIDVRNILVPVVFQTPRINPDAIRKAEVGLRDVELAVITIMDQGISPYAIKFDDVAEMIGSSGKKLKKDIRNMQKIATEQYDGHFDPPMPVPAEKLVYFMVAMMISECGRVSNDVYEYSVRKYMDEVFDLAALDTHNDLACWCFLIEYFEYCLRNNCRISVTKFLRDSANSIVTTQKLKRFIEKNDWYSSAAMHEEIFDVRVSRPTLSQVAENGLKIFASIVSQVQDDNAFTELDKQVVN